MELDLNLDEDIDPSLVISTESYWPSFHDFAAVTWRLIRSGMVTPFVKPFWLRAM